MSNAFIALILAVGAGTWVYSKLLRTTGNNVRSAITAALISGVLLFFVSLFVITFIANMAA